LCDKLKKIKTAIFISGRGSNMNALIEKSRNKMFPASVDLILSNNSKAEGLLLENANNIKSYFFSKNEFEILAQKILLEEKIELICLAGFIQILSKKFIQNWQNRLINIHPSYLPNFKGLNAQKQAILAKATYSGCTVHYVSSKIDGGEIILQKKVYLSDNEDFESLSKKILKEEHILYPKALEITVNKILNNII